MRAPSIYALQNLRSAQRKCVTNAFKPFRLTMRALPAESIVLLRALAAVPAKRAFGT